MGVLKVKVSMSSDPAAYTYKNSTQNGGLHKKTALPCLHGPVLRIEPQPPKVPASGVETGDWHMKKHTCNDNRNTHKAQKPPTLLVVFSRYFHGAT